jgi:hypothetical protein
MPTSVVVPITATGANSASGSGTPAWVIALVAVCELAVGAFLGVFVWRRRRDRQSNTDVDPFNLKPRGEYEGRPIIFPSSFQTGLSVENGHPRSNAQTEEGKSAFVVFKTGDSRATNAQKIDNTQGGLHERVCCVL